MNDNPTAIPTDPEVAQLLFKVLRAFEDRMGGAAEPQVSNDSWAVYPTWWLHYDEFSLRFQGRDAGCASLQYSVAASVEVQLHSHRVPIRLFLRRRPAAVPRLVVAVLVREPEDDDGPGLDDSL